jgi:site-specific DNA-methyltransferase (cytosine-N4-specific)
MGTKKIIDNNNGVNNLNVVYYQSAMSMSDVAANSVDLIITSPPYFNIKDYSKDGYQENTHSISNDDDIGNLGSFELYIKNLLIVWKECERALKPNGKLCVNVPLLPMIKKDYCTHYNRHIYDLQSNIQQSILSGTDLYLLDMYIWNRTNPSKKLMFGSYPYPRNFYAQNTIEFIAVYVKDGNPINNLPKEVKDASSLTQDEWTRFTKQIWNIPIPSKSDIAFGEHPAIMPEEIVRRCIRLFSFVGDTILDPFAGSGTTLKVACELDRNYIGYELYKNYKAVIEAKIAQAKGRRDG